MSTPGRRPPTPEFFRAFLDQGKLLNAFSYFDTWSLETVDHTLKPLLSPLLDETSKGVTTLSIPAELSQTFTNVLEEFGTDRPCRWL